MTKEILVELDERRRASLARIAHPGHSRYLTRTEPDGTIIMRPVDLVPAMPAPPTTTHNPADGEITFSVGAPHGWEDSMRRLRDLHQGADQREQAPVEPLQLLSPFAEPHPVDGTRPQEH